MSRPPILPNELISHILQYVTDKSTLANAALCSRQWYNMAVPHLFRSLDFEHGPETGYGGPFFEHLTILLLNKPALAAHVRNLSLRGCYFTESDGYDLDQSSRDYGRPIHHLPSAMQEAIISSRREYEAYPDWLRSDNLGDIYLTILLPALPRLETLDFEAPIQHLQILKRFGGINESDKSVAALSNLKELFWTCEERPPRECYFCSGLLALPSLKAIYLYRLVIKDVLWNKGTLKQLASREASTFTHLELRHCEFPKDHTIRFVLSASRALKTFIFEFYDTYYDISEIRRGLEKHQGSLEDLCLDTESTQFRSGFYDLLAVEDKRPMEHLKDFHRLKRVKIAPEFIFGLDLVKAELDSRPGHHRVISEFLPDGITVVHLTHCDRVHDAKIVLRALEYFILRTRTFTPHLAEISIDTNHNVVMQQIDEFIRVMDLANSMGIKFLLLSNSGIDKQGNRREHFERKWGFDEDVEGKGFSCRDYDGDDWRPLYEIIDIP